MKGNLLLCIQKINIKNGIPEKVDGPTEIISYDSKMPLDAELEYFINEKKPVIANGENGLDVVKILVEASMQLESDG